MTMNVNGRIRLGGFVEHFQIVEHISYSTGTSRDFVKHKRLDVGRDSGHIFREINHMIALLRRRQLQRCSQ